MTTPNAGSSHWTIVGSDVVVFDFIRDRFVIGIDPTPHVIRITELVDDQRERGESVTTTEEIVEVPFRLTRLILQNLGSCGPYVRKFTENFPEDQFPDGVEITEELCAQHCDAFDWDWALGNMLNYAGREQFDKLMRSRSAENRRFGTGQRRRAAVFGHIFDTMPNLRHEATLDMQTRAEERADDRALLELTEVQRRITHNEQRIALFQVELEQQRARLPELERATIGPMLRRAQRKEREARQAIERLQARVERSQQHAEEAAAEVERLRVIEAETRAENEAKNVEVPNDVSSLDRFPATDMP